MFRLSWWLKALMIRLNEVLEAESGLTRPDDKTLALQCQAESPYTLQPVPWGLPGSPFEWTPLWDHSLGKVCWILVHTRSWRVNQTLVQATEAFSLDNTSDVLVTTADGILPFGRAQPPHQYSPPIPLHLPLRSWWLGEERTALFGDPLTSPGNSYVICHMCHMAYHWNFVALINIK